MMPTIRIDDEVYAHLKQEAEPFVDTPNSVLRRVLGLDSESAPSEQSSFDGLSAPPSRATPGQTRSSAPTSRQRARRGSILPEEAYEVPIMQVLVSKGGEAPAREVIAAVGELLSDRLKNIDREPLRSGGVRWENKCQWARNGLCNRGLLDRDAPWGTWRITDAGRVELRGRTRR